ncbi:hypothetical protein [Gracilimonas sp.]|uniref:hypothetical protein n=1 Tax=Gracilimonas sp. TaxID=1974203 RepID=UPI002870D162|nr:hypothetical protein [Gracilimonas sp.]
MNESKIHSLIRTELQTQYEQAKQDWLSDMPFTYFDFDWEPDWDWLRCEVSINLGRKCFFLYKMYGSDWEDVLDGHVFQVWETMIEDFRADLENTKKDLLYDKKNRESESKCVYPR